MFNFIKYLTFNKYMNDSRIIYDFHYSQNQLEQLKQRAEAIPL